MNNKINKTVKSAFIEILCKEQKPVTLFITTNTWQRKFSDKLLLYFRYNIPNIIHLLNKMFSLTKGLLFLFLIIFTYSPHYYFNMCDHLDWNTLFL